MSHGPELAFAATLTMDELHRAQGEVAAVKITDDTVDALLAIRDACRGEGITASDRRRKKSLASSEHRRGWRARRRPAPRKVARIVGNLADPASTQPRRSSSTVPRLAFFRKTPSALAFALRR